MTKRLKKPRKTVGYGYSGKWQEGNVGWWLPNFINTNDKRRYPSAPNSALMKYDDAEARTTYLCKITIEPVTDALGRPITKRVKKEAAK